MRSCKSHQNRISSLAFHERRHGRSLVRPDDEISLPVSDPSPRLDAGWTVVDGSQIRELTQGAQPVASTATSMPIGPASAENLVDCDRNVALVEGLVDRLVADVPIGARRPRPPQPSTDLGRRPAQRELRGDRRTQVWIGLESALTTTTTPLVSLIVSEPGLIGAVLLLVAADLPVDALVALVDPLSDLLDRGPGPQAVSDLDPVVLVDESRTDWFLDKAHAASINEPNRTTTQRHPNRLRRLRPRETRADQLEIPSLCLLPIRSARVPALSCARSTRERPPDNVPPGELIDRATRGGRWSSGPGVP